MMKFPYSNKFCKAIILVFVISFFLSNNLISSPQIIDKLFRVPLIKKTCWLANTIIITTQSISDNPHLYSLDIENVAQILGGNNIDSETVRKSSDLKSGNELDSQTIRGFYIGRYGNILIYVSVLMLIVLLFYVYYYQKLKKETKKRKEIQSKLDYSEGEYKRIFNSLQDVYFRSDIDGIIKIISPSVFSMGGYTPEQVIGKPETIFYNDLSESEVVFKEIQQKGKISDFRLHLNKADGTVLPCSINSQILRDANGNFEGYEGMIRNVSESVKYANEIKESETMLNLAVDSANVGISNMLVNEKLFVFNNNFCDLLKLNTAINKLSFQSFLNLIHPSERNTFFNQFEKLLQNTTNTIEIECRILVSSKNYGWFFNNYRIAEYDLYGYPSKIIGAHLDIDFRKKTILSLQHNQRKLEAIYNSVPIMLVVVDSKLKIVEVNDTVIQYSNLMKDELIGYDVSSVFKWDDIYFKKTNENSDFEVNKLIQNAIDFKENFYNKEVAVEIITNIKTVELKYFSVSSSLFTIDEDLRVLITIMDISQRKIADKEIEKSRNILEENNKLKSDFISNISSEIRTPINSIIGFVHLLKNRSIAIEQKERYVEVIQKSSSQLLSIIENIIELSNVEFDNIEVRKTEFNILLLIKEIEASFIDKITEKNLTYHQEIQIPNEKMLFSSDVVKIKQIISSFIENSIKFTKSGKITVGAYYEKEKLWFFVRDTGIGIENAEDLLTNSTYSKDQFETHNDNQLQGQSLTISKAYIEALGGQLQVESQIGKGSKFSFYLPTIEIVNVAEKIKIEDYSKVFKGCILIVEDEDYNYNYLSQILELAGYDHIIADDGQKAIDRIKERPDISLVLMDIRLPGIDGLEAAKIIKGINPKIPIIAQTAYGFSTEEDKQMELFCDDYIQKPIVSKILLSKIEKLLFKQ